MSSLIETANPATGSILETYRGMDDEDVSDAIARAMEAFSFYRGTSFDDRSRWVNRLADLLESGVDRLAELMTHEMGKPIVQARAEIRKCALVCQYYADNAETFLADEPVETDEFRSFIAYEPLGPILAVMPWNFPFWQVLRFAAPAAMAGNTMLLKHASNVLGCGEAIAQLLEDAGFPNGVFQHLIIDHDQLAEVIADVRVRGVTLTGSDRAGRAVAGQAGKHLKKVVLELGGSDPFIVLADADIERAVDTAVLSRTQNTGQSCIAAKRFIVEESVSETFIQRFSEKMSELVVGDPMNENTQIGPMARVDLRDELHNQVRRSIAEGATALTGGRPFDGAGAWYPPTVLVNVEPGSVAFDEELFGPVAAVTVVANVDEAVAAANASRFGLGGAVFTSDLEKGEQVARRLECGCAFVNDMVRSDPRLPFGGMKDSGVGRELGVPGIREFVNVKTICIR